MKKKYSLPSSHQPTPDTLYPSRMLSMATSMSAFVHDNHDNQILLGGRFLDLLMVRRDHLLDPVKQVMKIITE